MFFCGYVCADVGRMEVGVGVREMIGERREGCCCWLRDPHEGCKEGLAEDGRERAGHPCSGFFLETPEEGGAGRHRLRMGGGWR